MTGTEAFLQSVRRALTDRGEPVPLPDDVELARVVRADTDPIAVFLERVEQAKMAACRVSNEPVMLDRIIEIVKTVGARSAIVPDEAIPGREQILDRLRASGVTLCDTNDRDAGFVADVGITGVEAAVAETGSMCLFSGGPRRRLASLAVPVHIGIVRAEQILPDLLDWARMLPPELPAKQVLVSAPSKTADIELTLVMGVHGPKQEYVIVLG